MPDFSELEKFTLYHYWSYCESVNVFLMVGTNHPEYQGMSEPFSQLYPNIFPRNQFS